LINTCSNVPLILQNEGHTLHVHEESVAFDLCSVLTIEDYHKVYDFLIAFFKKAAPVIVEYPFRFGKVAFKEHDIFVNDEPVSQDISLMKEVLQALMQHAKRIADARR